MRTKIHWRLDGIAVSRATLSEINTRARERAEFTTVWSAEIKRGRRPFLGPVSSQVSILRKILERGRITVLSQELEAQILKLVGDQTGRQEPALLALQFAHQVQILAVRLLCNFVITGVAKAKIKLYCKIAQLALRDLRGLDQAVADLYDLPPLCQELDVAIGEEKSEYLVVALGSASPEDKLVNMTKIGDATSTTTSVVKTVEVAEATKVSTTVAADGVELDEAQPNLLDLCQGQEQLICCGSPEKPIKFLLNYIFGFPDFRPSQIDSIIRILQGKDTIALLPTGSGKSVIFQMLALIRPGFGLVVAPIVSLIYDQVDNLQRRGIDRVAGITAGTTDKAELMERVVKGEILLLYVAPERLVIKDFQAQLKRFAAGRNFSILAIDEAHCVSEWGHDFRTSYLNLARICRQLAPGAPLLALTGTASARILQEMCMDLDMPASAVQRPDNFDRPEIHFDVVRAPVQEKSLALRRILTELLPKKFGISPTEFYRLQGVETMSGIIFCPHVGGDFGVVKIKEMVKTLGLVATEYYGQQNPAERRAGELPWTEQKQQNAARFKDNLVPLLVATKSFGMGVDKPNIRYVIHYCPSASIEAYYQEAGRGGRDREVAWSFVIISNDKEKRNADLLARKTAYPDFKAKFMGRGSGLEQRVKRLTQKVQAKIAESLQLEETDELQDDVDLLLHFHVHNFTGPQEELAAANAILLRLGDLSMAGEVSLKPKYSEIGSIEKSIFRLQRAGFIRSYTVDFAKREYLLNLVGLTEREEDRARARLEAEIEQSYTETEPERRCAIGKIVEIMTTAGDMVDPDERDDYLRKEIVGYLTSE